MPIISEIGRRSARVRILYAFIYLLLVVGAITMIYPLMLMVSGSLKSEADSWSMTAYPEFWFDDLVLFQKYAEAKYNGEVDSMQNAWCSQTSSWRSVKMPVRVQDNIVEDFVEWRKSIPVELRSIGFFSQRGMLPKNLRAYRNWMSVRFDGDISAYNIAANQVYNAWTSVEMPVEILGRYRNSKISEDFRKDIARWKETIPESEQIIEGARSHYLKYLHAMYTKKIEEYNSRHGTCFRSYGDVPFPSRAPAAKTLERTDWISFVRNGIMLMHIRLDPSLEPPFRSFLGKNYEDIGTFNKLHGVNMKSFDEVPFPEKLNDSPWLKLDFVNFINSDAFCPPEKITIEDPERSFLAFLVRKYKRVPENYPGLGAVCAAADWKDCMDDSTAVRWEFTARNYIHVIGFILTYGNGLLNTLILCSLAILSALIINPIAAYALSRFKLPGTYKILLFCMATMAFPGEVTMIPSFLLLKSFPLWPVLTGTAVTLLCFILLEKLFSTAGEGWRALASLAAGLCAGGLILPFFLPGATSTSLLNTFAALILPGMASGYSIFLLKGFFDSMPKELYEAADIDGANEWIKFWMLTMNLSKPILAVMALGAFTGAYSAFMMALVIIPDQKMWTIMVWIYQLQSQSHYSVVYASLVIAAIPTFIIFVFCQNIIIRGIVVPTEK